MNIDFITVSFVAICFALELASMVTLLLDHVSESVVEKGACIVLPLF